MRRETGHFTRNEINPFCTQKRTVPTHHRVPDALRWCSRLAMDVGEGQKRTRCTCSPVRRRGGVCCMRRETGSFYSEINPSCCTHTETVRSIPPITAPQIFCCHCHHHACCINYRMFDVFADTKRFLHKNTLTPKSSLQHQKYSSPHQKEEM
jgi:hypothetical protein